MELPECWEAGQGAWPVLEEVEQEEVRPLSGEGGVNPADGVRRAGDGDSDLREQREGVCNCMTSDFIFSQVSQNVQ